MADQVLPYEGASYHCSDSVLDARKVGEEVRFCAADDLHSLVRCARELASCNCLAFKTEMEQLGKNDFEGIKKFWAQKLGGPWKAAVAAADAVQYSNLKHAFAELHID